MYKKNVIVCILFSIILTGVSFFLPTELKMVSGIILVSLYPALFGLKGSLSGIFVSVALMFILDWQRPFLTEHLRNGLIIAYIFTAVLVGSVIEGYKRDSKRLINTNKSLENENAQIKLSEGMYRSFFENMTDGFSYQKVVYDNEGKPVDFIFLELNHSFERLTGFKRENLVGRKVTEAIPGVTDPFYDWLGYYEKTARSGKEVRVEKYYQSLDKTYAISLNSSEFGYFYASFHDITDIHGAGDEYKKLVENTKDIIARFDKNSNCTYLNIGGEFKNRRPMDIIFGNIGVNTRIPNEIKSKWENAFRQVFRSKKEESIELSVKTPQGTRYFECRLVPEFSHEGYVDSILSINRDDTIHMSASENMKQTLDKLKELENIINASPIVVFLWLADKNWTMEFISTNVDQFGYSQLDFINGNLSFFDLIHPEDIERVNEEINVYLDQGVNDFIQEYRIKTKREEEKLVKIEIWVRRNLDGEATHYQGMITDVTNMINIPQYLKDSEKQYREVFDTSHDIVFILNIKGMFISVNHEGEELFGYSREDLKTMSFLKFIAQENQEQAELILEEMVSGVVKEKEYKIKVLSKNGVAHYLKLFCSEVLESGHLSISVKARDITERNQVAEQVHYLSFHDKLTGLYNRTFFEEELTRLQTETTVPLSIVVGDVDGLKLTNDAFGHKQGDLLLKKIAEILKISCRVEDTVIRLGGDEFAVIMPEVNEREATRFCSRIRNLCSQAVDVPVQPSIALGMATMTDKSMDIEEIVREAEERMNRSKLMESRSIRSSIISSLQKTLEERTFETKKHAERMQKLAEKMGTQLGLSESEMDELNLLCVLHDIGKIGIPDNILMKTGRLTADEWEIMKKHTEIGFNIAISSPDLKSIAEGILAHHENWDGTGYPKHLEGEQIPRIARIITVIDAYDAMTNDRPYHKATSQIAAIIEIDRCSGSQFDPTVVEAFKKELLK